MAELQGVVLQPLSLGLAVPLDPYPLLADLLQLPHRLLTVALMLLQELAVAFSAFLLQLLAAGGKLLLHLGHAGLVLLLCLGNLVACLQHQLFALLAGLLSQFRHMAFGFLADGGTVDQLLPFPFARGDDLLALLAGLVDEFLPLTDQLHGLGQLDRQGLAQAVENLDGILFVHQPTAAEGDPAAFQHYLFELVELIEGGDGGLGHGEV